MKKLLIPLIFLAAGCNFTNPVPVQTIIDTATSTVNDVPPQIDFGYKYTNQSTSTLVSITAGLKNYIGDYNIEYSINGFDYYPMANTDSPFFRQATFPLATDTIAQTVFLNVEQGTTTLINEDERLNLK